MEIFNTSKALFNFFLQFETNWQFKKLIFIMAKLILAKYLIVGHNFALIIDFLAPRVQEGSWL